MPNSKMKHIILSNSPKFEAHNYHNSETEEVDY